MNPINISFGDQFVQNIPFNDCRDMCIQQCTQITYENMINNYLMFPIIASVLLMGVFLYISTASMNIVHEDKKELFDTVAYYVFAIGIFLLLVFFYLIKNSVRMTELIRIG